MVCKWKMNSIAWVRALHEVLEAGSRAGSSKVVATSGCREVQGSNHLRARIKTEYERKVVSANRARTILREQHK